MFPTIIKDFQYTKILQPVKTNIFYCLFPFSEQMGKTQYWNFICAGKRELMQTIVIIIVTLGQIYFGTLRCFCSMAIKNSIMRKWESNVLTLIMSQWRWTTLSILIIVKLFKSLPWQKSENIWYALYNKYIQICDSKFY